MTFPLPHVSYGHLYLSLCQFFCFVSGPFRPFTCHLQSFVLLCMQTSLIRCWFMYEIFYCSLWSSCFVYTVSVISISIQVVSPICISMLFQIIYFHIKTLPLFVETLKCFISMNTFIFLVLWTVYYESCLGICSIPVYIKRLIRS